jgi:hypothetical protein
LTAKEVFMTSQNPSRDEMLARLGYKPLNRTLAKLEIVLGLLAAGIGLFLGQWVCSRPVAEFDWLNASFALLLFVLGGYLTLAGHRSHLYQSANETTAYLLQELQNRKAKGPTA